MRKKILVVEDEPDLQELVRYNLTKAGFDVVLLDSGEACLQQIGTILPDLLLLDIMLPGRDGFEVCRELKSRTEFASIPIVMLTAKGEEADVVFGLELGAEDYVTKPFSPKVLIARLQSILRRQELSDPSKQRDEADVLEVFGLRIDYARHKVFQGDEVLELTHTEFKLLSLFAKNRGRVFTRVQVVSEVHGDDYPVTPRSVDVQVVGLRKKLGQLGNLIETVRGVGYRMREEE